MAVRRLFKRLKDGVGKLAGQRRQDNGHNMAAAALPGSRSNTEFTFPNELANVAQDKKLREELIAVIREKRISALFQPIIDLKMNEIIAYEAFCHGPEDSLLYSPFQLFAAASKYQLLFALERVCRETALRDFHSMGAKLLFFGTNAEVANIPEWKGGRTKQFTNRQVISEQKVVIEVNEKIAASDFNSFSNIVHYYRQQGCRVAVDDVGAVYASLQAVAELRPDYLKIDSSIVRDIDKNPFKQAILEAMLKLAAVIDCKIVAKGVETPEELSTLIKMDVQYAQGPFIANPRFPPADTGDDVKDFIRQVHSRNLLNKARAKELGLGVTIGEIVQSTPTVGKDVLVSQVEGIFAGSNVNGVVIVSDGVPVGLLMKHKLYFQLGTHYGVSLYHKRPVALVMDKAPLIVNAELPIESVAQIAMAREEYNLYDLIIVVKDNRYLGTVSIMNLLNNITKLQISRAHNANPLTGLPGNLIIEHIIKGLVERREIFAILYIDLDNFKAYNDKYGFEKGDTFLLLTASVLSRSLAKEGCGEDFIGHIGGDDFIIITKPDCAIKVAQTIIAMFDTEVVSLYQPEDWAKGYIEVKNRRGYTEQFPLVSISIAIVSSEHRHFTNYLEIGEVAAELKKLAKQTPASSYVIDRRQQGN